MLAALLPPQGVHYRKMTDDTEAGWRRGERPVRIERERGRGKDRDGVKE